MKEFLRTIAAGCFCIFGLLVYVVVMITAGFLITVILESIIYGF